MASLTTCQARVSRSPASTNPMTRCGGCARSSRARVSPICLRPSPSARNATMYWPASMLRHRKRESASSSRRSTLGFETSIVVASRARPQPSCRWRLTVSCRGGGRNGRRRWQAAQAIPGQISRRPSSLRPRRQGHQRGRCPHGRHVPGVSAAGARSSTAITSDSQLLSMTRGTSRLICRHISTCRRACSSSKSPGRSS